MRGKHILITATIFSTCLTTTAFASSPNGNTPQVLDKNPIVVNQIDQLNAQIDQFNKTIAQQQQIVNNQQSQIHNLTVTLDTYQQTINTQQTTINSLQEQISVTKGTLPVDYLLLNEQYVHIGGVFLKDPSPSNVTYTINDFNNIQVGDTAPSYLSNWTFVEELYDSSNSNQTYWRYKTIGNTPNSYLEVWIDGTKKVLAVTRGGGVK